MFKHQKDTTVIVKNRCDYCGELKTDVQARSKYWVMQSYTITSCQKCYFTSTPATKTLP